MDLGNPSSFATLNPDPSFKAVHLSWTCRKQPLRSKVQTPEMKKARGFGDRGSSGVWGVEEFGELRGLGI